VLVGDIGGTKTLLARAAIGDARVSLSDRKRYANQVYEDFGELLRDYLGAGKRDVELAVFAVAGPVSGDEVALTNLAWTLSAAKLKREFGFRHVVFLNDFAATAEGIENLEPGDLVSLQTGEAALHGTRAVIGAGTGLGESFLVWCDNRYIAVATEGGHKSFAPVDETQVALLEYLRQRYQNVGIERVVSGPGLVDIYRFLSRDGDNPPAVEVLAHDDPAKEIVRRADTGSDPVAIDTVRLFCRAYGAEAGNLALATRANGGVFIAGGIAAKIRAWLQEGEFVRAFIAKDKMRQLLERVPVWLITNPEVALAGAARVALRIIGHRGPAGGNEDQDRADR
jgi:glucokinase